jgi:hypothetical protein
VDKHHDQLLLFLGAEIIPSLKGEDSLLPLNNLLALALS